MILMEEVLVYGGVSFRPLCTSRVDEGIRVRVAGRRSSRAASVLPYLLSCWWACVCNAHEVRRQAEKGRCGASAEVQGA